MADYLKRVQSRLKSKGYTLGRQEIIDRLSEIDADVDDINYENISEYVNELIQLIQSKSSTEIQTSAPTQKQIVEVDHHTALDILEAETDEDAVESSIANIVLSDSQKLNLVRSASNQLGITLIGNEIKEISQTIGSQFGDRREMLSAITNALTAYAAHITAQEQQIVSEAFDRVRGQVSTSNSNIKQAFNSLEEDIKEANLDMKSFQADILQLFAIN